MMAIALSLFAMEVCKCHFTTGEEDTMDELFRTDRRHASVLIKEIRWFRYIASHYATAGNTPIAMAWASAADRLQKAIDEMTTPPPPTSLIDIDAPLAQALRHDALVERDAARSATALTPSPSHLDTLGRKTPWTNYFVLQKAIDEMTTPPPPTLTPSPSHLDTLELDSSLLEAPSATVDASADACNAAIDDLEDKPWLR